MKFKKFWVGLKVCPLLGSRTTLYRICTHVTWHLILYSFLLHIHRKHTEHPEQVSADTKRGSEA